MTTFHLGDCSNSCNECARRCAENQHRECTGTDAQRAIDGSPYSARSVAYDYGRTLRQSENGGQR